jgi:hypothetical protein
VYVAAAHSQDFHSDSYKCSLGSLVLFLRGAGSPSRYRCSLDKRPLVCFVGFEIHLTHLSGRESVVVPKLCLAPFRPDALLKTAEIAFV